MQWGGGAPREGVLRQAERRGVGAGVPGSTGNKGERALWGGGSEGARYTGTGWA